VEKRGERGRLRAETERSGGVDAFDREAEAHGLEDCGEAAEGGIAFLGEGAIELGRIEVVRTRCWAPGMD